MRRRTLAPVCAVGMLASMASLGCAADRLSGPVTLPGPPLPISEVVRRAQALVAVSALSYVSDYFSFVGQDERGRVAFALDNNRGRDGDIYQADQRVIMQDERTGWVDLGPAHVVYPNPDGVLWRIPPSPAFQVDGDAEHGFSIHSRTSSLALRTDPLITRTSDFMAKSIFAMSSARATLSWRDRTIRGRVIAEYLVLEGQNRLAHRPPLRSSLKMRFEGLYLLAGGDGDVYVHGAVAPERDVPPVLGFTVLDGSARQMSAIQFDVTSHALAGIYRWPQRWHVTWRDGGGDEQRTALDVRIVVRRKEMGWVVGGYAMSIVKGELQVNGERMPVYGFGEIIE